MAQSIPLAYFLVYTNQGTPLYSRCWGTACQLFSKSQDLLTGFLSAITAFSDDISQDKDSLKAVDLKDYQLRFQRSRKIKNLIFCIFVPKDQAITEELQAAMSQLFTEVDDFTAQYFAEQQLTIADITPEKSLNYSRQLESTVLTRWTHVHESIDNDHDETCPLCMNTLLGEAHLAEKPVSFVDRIKYVYFSGSKELSAVKTKRGKIKIGSEAPDFSGITDEGSRVRLRDWRGHYVVLFFFPSAGSPVCTREARAFRNNYDELVKMNVKVLGISRDPPEKLKWFRHQEQLPFPLLSDEDGHISSQYGGVGRFGKSNRMTYLIDPDGRILRIWKLTGLFAQMRIQEHVKDVVKTLKSMRTRA